MKKISIKKGLTLYLEDADKFSVSTFCILFRLPLNRDMVTLNALLSKLFLQGCKKYNSEIDIAIRLEEILTIMDAQIMKKGEEHIIQIYFKSENEYVEEAFELVSDIILGTSLNNLEFAKKQLKSDIEELRTDKRSYAVEKCIENMCNNEIYGINGDGYIEDIDNISDNDIKKHYEYLISSANIDIMAIGNCKEDNIREYIDNYLKFDQREIINVNTQYKYIPEEVKDIEEQMDITQSKLVLGIRMNIEPQGDMWYKALVANEIFGGGPSSILFNKAREAEGLCYYISSRILRFKSIMLIEAGIESKSKDKILGIVKESLMNIETDDIETAKKNIINSFNTSEDKAERIMDYTLGQIVLGSYTSIDDAIAGIKNVSSVKDVFNACKLDTVYMLRS